MGPKSSIKSVVTTDTSKQHFEEYLYLPCKRSPVWRLNVQVWQPYDRLCFRRELN